MNNNSNMFISMIYGAMAFSWRKCFKYWKYKRDLKKFEKNIINGSPTFDILWQMADFIKYAEKLFFISNTQKDELYSSPNYSVGQNGFKVNDYARRIKITVKLITEYNNNKVYLEIEGMDTSSGKTFMSFTNNDWDKSPTCYDEILLDTAIESINLNIISLFWMCYGKRMSCINHTIQNSTRIL